MHSAIEPCLAIDAVYREYLHLAGVDRIFYRVDNIETLVFEVIGRRRGKHQKREPVVPVGYDFHPLVEAGAMPAIDESLHSFYPGCRGVPF